MEDPYPRLEDTFLHSKLLKKATSLLITILGNRTLAATKTRDHERSFEELVSILSEITVLWDCSGQSTRLIIADDVLNVDQAVELFYDVVYRLCKDYSAEANSPLKEPALLVLKLMCNWASSSHTLQLRIIGSGLLFASLSSVQHLLPYLQQEDEMAKMLVTFNLGLLHKCLMKSAYRLVYAYSEDDWYGVLKPLTHDPDIEVRLYSKLVVCHITEAFSNDQLSSLLVLGDTDVDAMAALCDCGTVATTKDKIHPFRVSLTSIDVMTSVKIFLTYSDHCKLLALPQFSACLSALLISQSSDERKTAQKLILEAQLDPLLKDAMPQILVKGSEPSDVWMDILLKYFDSFSLNCIPGLCESLITQLSTLHDEPDLSSSERQTSFTDILEFMLKLSLSHDNFFQVIDASFLKFIEAIYGLMSRIFDAIDDIEEDYLSCLPVILLCVLNWAYYSSVVRYMILSHGLFVQHVHQLKILTKMEHFLLSKLLVNLNLGIILNCVQDIHLSEDINWPLVLKPWLESNEDTKLVAFLICGYVAHHFQDEDLSPLKLRISEAQLLIHYLTTAVWSTQLSVKLKNNLFSITALTIVRALTNLHKVLKVLPKHKELFCAVANLLFTGQKSEIKVACLFLSAIYESGQHDELIDNCELPILEVLEQLQESDDPEVKKIADTTSLKLQGHWDEALSDEAALSKKKYLKLLKDASSNLEFCVNNFAINKGLDCGELMVIFSQVRHIYITFDPQSQSELSEYAADSCSLIKLFCTFICKLLEGEVNKMQLQCLNIMLSIISSWCDKNRRIRYQLVRSELLFYLTEFVSLLTSIADPICDSLALLALIIISNCSQERDFGLLYTPPGKVDWSVILESWMNSTNRDLSFSAKLIAGHLNHILDDKLYLLDLGEEAPLFIDLFCDSVQSKTLVGSGFGCQFSAEELARALRYFLLNANNFFHVSISTHIPTALMKLYIRGGISVKEEVCRLLLYLFDSSAFMQRFRKLESRESLIGVDVDENESPTLKFLRKCVSLRFQQEQSGMSCKSEPAPTRDSKSAIICFEVDSFPEVVRTYGDFFNWIATKMSRMLEKYEGRTLSLPNSKATLLLITAVEELHRFWKNCISPLQIAILQHLTTCKVEHLTVIHDFSVKAFWALNTCEGELIGPLYISLLLCFHDWVQLSDDLCILILERGLLLDYLRGRANPERTKDTTFATFVVSAKLSIIHHCVQAKGIDVYYHKVSWYKFLTSWITCPHQEIRILSKLIASHVTPSFDEQMLSFLHFDREDAKALVDLLHKAASSMQFSAKGSEMFFSYRLSTLLRSINSLFVCSSCEISADTHLYELFDTLVNDNQKIMLSLTVVMTSGDINDRTQGCYLLWNLLDNENFKKNVDLQQTSRLLKLHHHDSPQELKYLCESILLFLNDSLHKDVEGLQLHAHVCYLQGKYGKCVNLCEELLQHPTSDSVFMGRVKYLKGKATYQNFVLQQHKLSLSELTEDVRKTISKGCYQLNVQAIILLAEAIDCGYVYPEEKDEAVYILDRAMMDCIYEANMLNVVRRCYMCRRTINVGEKLIKSHVIPRALLEDRCAEFKGNKQVILAPRTSMRHSRQRLLTPAELVYYMMCFNCEEAISKHGEIQFPGQFFHKLYADVTAEQTIEYGPWLYQFCVSLMFRAMHWSPGSHCNDLRVYKVYKEFHVNVLSWLKLPDDSTVVPKPKIYIFINPTRVGLVDSPHGYMNWLFKGGLAKFFGHQTLDDDSIPELNLCAHYYAVQINLITIIVPFYDEFIEDKFQRFLINPIGGSLWIPPERQRKPNIPRGLWCVFQDLSKSLKKQVYKYLETVISKSIKSEGSQSRTYTVDSSGDSFGVGKAMVTDASPIIKHVVFKSHHRSELLPPEFAIRSTGNFKVALPKGHVVLLHSNYIRGPGQGSTFFLAVGNSPKYPLHKPYVLWYFYDPSSEVSCGAFFSIDTFEITSFLAGDEGITIKALAQSSLKTARMRMPTIIKDLLKEKGFSSIHSLLYRVKAAIQSGRDPPPMDTKCGSERKCWYCKFLCQNCCSKPASYGRISNTPNGRAVFCSKACQILSPEMFTSALQVFQISPMEPHPKDVHIHCVPVSSSHHEIQHIYIRLLNKKKFPCEMEIAICVGDGTDADYPSNRPYVVFYSHHLFHQLFVEFFINDELLAEEPLPKVSNEASWNAILQLNEAAAVRKILEKANLETVTLLKLAEVRSGLGTKIGIEAPKEYLSESIQW